MQQEHDGGPRIAVAGTGIMGSSLARAFAAAGHTVTAWNRTRARAEALSDFGVAVADDLVAAIARSDVVVMCVANQAVATGLLSEQSVVRGLRCKSLIQLTTGTPGDARKNAEWASDHDVAYVDGAIMAYPRANWHRRCGDLVLRKLARVRRT